MNKSIGTLVVNLAEAAAERGDIQGAEQAIASMHQVSGPTAKGLDLLARIRILKGDRRAAEQLWKEAYRLDPSNGASIAALQCLQRLGRKPFWLLAPTFYLGMAVLVLGITGLTLAALKLSERSSAITAPAPPPFHQGLLLSAGPSPTKNEARHQESQSQAEFQLPPLQGCETVKTSAGVLLRFPMGLFREGDQLQVGAQEVLQSVAIHLRYHPTEIQVFVKGTTDSKTIRKESPYESNEILALHRAALVAQIIRKNGSLAAATVCITSALPRESESLLAGRVHISNERSVEILISPSTLHLEDPR